MSLLDLFKNDLKTKQEQELLSLINGNFSFSNKNYKDENTLSKSAYIVVDKIKENEYIFYSFQQGKVSIGTNNYISVEKGSELANVFNNLFPKGLANCIESVDPISGREILSNIIFTGFVSPFVGRYKLNADIRFLIKFLNCQDLSKPTKLNVGEHDLYFYPGFTELIKKHGILSLIKV